MSSLRAGSLLPGGSLNGLNIRNTLSHKNDYTASFFCAMRWSRSGVLLIHSLTYSLIVNFTVSTPLSEDTISDHGQILSLNYSMQMISLTYCMIISFSIVLTIQTII